MTETPLTKAEAILLLKGAAYHLNFGELVNSVQNSERRAGCDAMFIVEECLRDLGVPEVEIDLD